jgi:hypothetical protein
LRDIHNLNENKNKTSISQQIYSNKSSIPQGSAGSVSKLNSTVPTTTSATTSKNQNHHHHHHHSHHHHHHHRHPHHNRPHHPYPNQPQSFQDYEERHRYYNNLHPDEFNNQNRLPKIISIKKILKSDN